MRLTGFEAITFAEHEGLTLSKFEDRIDEPQAGLSIAEAEAIAVDHPELIYLDITDEEYARQRNVLPER
jgi:hypothetical protein